MTNTIVDHATWATQELGRANLGDVRRTKRLIRIVTDKLANPTASIPQLSAAPAATKAVYRYFASPEIATDDIRAAHQDATRARTQEHGTVLVLQDTTELNYTMHPHTADLGPLDRTHLRGLKVHSGMATTPAGVPLGIIHQATWVRDEAPLAVRSRKRPQIDRESQRWLTTLTAAQTAIPAPTRLIIVADREADIYPLFAAARQSRTDLVIRSTYNRALVGRQKRDAVAATVDWQGTRTVVIRGNGTRAPRRATVAIGWTTQQILPPTDYPKPASAPRPCLTLVIVEERDPPAHTRPLRWLLWTTIDVTDWATAIHVVAAYEARWLIERYHYVLKSGCGMEELQLATADRLERALAVFSIVAWRLLWLTYQARETPDAPCTVAFATHEWQALVCTVAQTQVPPSTPPSLQTAVRMVAQLGGFQGRAGDGEPGVKVIWRGLTRLRDIAATWLLLRGDST